jgi:uncharacterized protein (DUF362 family)/ferredoxin
MAKAAVSIQKCQTYDSELLRRALAAALEPFGGMGAYVSRGDRVLIKPNLLMARAVEKHVCTHPEVVLATAEAAFDAGAAKVFVGDSPGFGTSLGVLRKLGLANPMAERGIQVASFDSPVEVVRGDTVRYRRFEVERAVLEVDKVINLVKVKTHAQMFMTLAVKNTFGYVVGTRKAAWHLEAGRDVDLFATMLLDLHHLRKPDLHVADGIVMMEGNGPGSGTPRSLGLLLAGNDGSALDAAICEILNVPQSHVPTLKVAAKLGLGVTDLKQVSWHGPTLSDIAIEGIDHPILSHPGNFLAPRPLQRFARRLLEVRPVVNPKACVGCRICMEACPAKAITMVNKGESRAPIAKIHPPACIHCYCCQELCPEGAIAPKRGFVRSFMRRPGQR